MDEQWKDIKGYEGLYRISDKGTVKSITFRKCVHGIRTQTPAEVIMKPFDNGKGYQTITLTKDGKNKNHYIHRLVAEAFKQNPECLPEVNHKDYDKSNNCADNLEWCTRRENILHSACNMSVQHNQIGKSGLRYITIDKKGKFRVCIKKANIDRRFSSENDAIEFRNEVLHEIGYTI